MLNAFWDWGSLSLSRRLGQGIVAKPSAGRALALAALDLGAALLFLVTLSAVLPFAAGLVESWSGVFLGLATYLKTAAAKPWTEGLWATFMLFSTLLPTAAHGAIAIFSIIPLAGRKSWRLKLKQQIESTKAVDHWWPALYFSFWLAASVALVGLAGWGLAWLLVFGDVPVADTLLRIALWSLTLAGGPGA